MHGVLPVVVSMGLVGFGSFELEIGTSVRTSPSGFWISLYIPSTNGVISIWNAIIEKKVRCLSIAFLHYKDVIQPIKQLGLTMSSTLTTQYNREKGF